MGGWPAVWRDDRKSRGTPERTLSFSGTLPEGHPIFPRHECATCPGLHIVGTGVDRSCQLPRACLSGELHDEGGMDRQMPDRVDRGVGRGTGIASVPFAPKQRTTIPFRRVCPASPEVTLFWTGKAQDTGGLSIGSSNYRPLPWPSLSFSFCTVDKPMLQ